MFICYRVRVVFLFDGFSWQASPIEGMSGYHYDPLWTVELALRIDVPRSPTGDDPAAAETNASDDTNGNYVNTGIEND